MSSVLDWLCLSLIPGLGPVGRRRLLDRYHTPAQILATSRTELCAVGGLRAKQLEGFSELPAVRKLAEKTLGRLEGLGAELLTFDDPFYPEPLRQIPDGPVLLYLLGDKELLSSRCVAIVGSRSATAYGRKIARSFARDLVGTGITVVSGLALGIDSEAHRGALDGQGQTVAVLGCGLDVVYPKQNVDLFDSIRRQGLIVSEYPPGTQPEGFRFPARNRIIAGMSAGIVVVEAAKKSGSLITAQLGLDFGREIFAVPGQVDSYKSEGAHWLIRQGAQLVVSAEDVAAGLWPGDLYRGCTGQAGRQPEPLLEDDAALLMEALEPYPQTRDEIYARTGLGPARAAELILYLELEGLLEVVAGDRLKRASRP